MKCYIIDDELHAIELLIAYINRVPGLELAGSSTSPMTGILEIKAGLSVDAVFLDVDMPEISGLEAIQLLPDRTPVVFTTAYSNYAVNAFEFNAVDFLLKPISFAKFLKSIDKLERNMPYKARDVMPVESDPLSMFIKPGGGKGKVVQVHFSDILYIEGLKNYVVVYTNTGAKYISYLTMNEIVMAVPESKFIRIHRSYIVSISKIKSIEGNTINLAEYIQLPLGISYKDQFMAAIASITIQSSRNNATGA